jgi:mannose-1-phosphate guanylyltransferase/mannose-1-phosphate guanylyltransferase/mannose-6-phosphate isomerase
MYVVILAGGGGTRLWPLSRPDRPKPFLPLLSEESLFQRTVRRVAPLVGEADIFCVAERRYADLVEAQDPSVQRLVEPAARNTAAAIALATAAIDRPDDEVMVVLPADHWIADEDGFRQVLGRAHDDLAGGAFGIDQPLVTLGVHVDRPATEYGYLLPDLERSGADAPGGYVLRAFEEKPHAARAAELLDEPGVAWNAGMFLWQRGAIRAALERYTSMAAVIAPAVASDAELAEAYDAVTPLSIDHAVMEHAAADAIVLMAAMDVGWSDVGSWTALLGAIAGDAAPPPGDAAPRPGGRVVPPGEVVDTASDDLVIRTTDSRLVLEEPGEGRIVADGVLAHLTGARAIAPQVRALLDRVERQESRA